MLPARSQSCAFHIRPTAPTSLSSTRHYRSLYNHHPEHIVSVASIARRKANPGDHMSWRSLPRLTLYVSFSSILIPIHRSAPKYLPIHNSRTAIFMSSVPGMRVAYLLVIIDAHCAGDSPWRNVTHVSEQEPTSWRSTAVCASGC